MGTKATRLGLWVGETSPKQDTETTWVVAPTLERLKRALSSDVDVISIDSHLSDGNSSTEALSLIANKYLSGDLKETLKVTSHAKASQHRIFVSRRWREVKQELWDL